MVKTEPVTTVAPYSSQLCTRAVSPATVMACVMAGACRSLVSTSSEPPGASQPGASAATRRSTASPSWPPSSATRGSWSRASGGRKATSGLGTYGALQIRTVTRPRSAAGSGPNRSPW